ncbi:MAG: hypothetical protein M1823_004614 [Watsoniomyces obsoletus]|nr:MAG: hypothetical protein M1823_004614 [Watsoniomyces obsoletus]
MAEARGRGGDGEGDTLSVRHARFIQETLRVMADYERHTEKSLEQYLSRRKRMSGGGGGGTPVTENGGGRGGGAARGATTERPTGTAGISGPQEPEGQRKERERGVEQAPRRERQEPAAQPTRAGSGAGATATISTVGGGTYEPSRDPRLRRRE